MKFTQQQIDQMRFELEHHEEIKNLINTTRRMFIEQGRDFDKEFEQWEKKKKEKNDL